MLCKTSLSSACYCNNGVHEHICKNHTEPSHHIGMCLPLPIKLSFFYFPRSILACSFNLIYLFFHSLIPSSIPCPRRPPSNILIPQMHSAREREITKKIATKRKKMQASREKIRSLQSKATAFNERVKLLNQRATPDEHPLRVDVPLETHFTWNEKKN